MIGATLATRGPQSGTGVPPAAKIPKPTDQAASVSATTHSAPAAAFALEGLQCECFGLPLVVVCLRFAISEQLPAHFAVGIANSLAVGMLSRKRRGVLGRGAVQARRGS